MCFFCLFFRKAGLSKTRAVGFGRQRAHGGRLPVPTLRLSSLTCHRSASRLSDCNKENALRNCVPARGSLRAEEQQQQRPGSEGSTKSSPWKADGQRHAFDYVELSPLQQDPPSQGSPPRTRGSLRGSERAPKHHEDLERDLALRSEERRRWFESPDSGVPTADGLGGDSSRKAGEPDLPPSPLSEEQRARLNEEIEKKWLELERLPLKDSRRVPLTALLNQGKGNQGGDLNEALRKEVRASVPSESWLRKCIPWGFVPPWQQEAPQRSQATHAGGMACTELPFGAVLRLVFAASFLSFTSELWGRAACVSVGAKHPQTQIYLWRRACPPPPLLAGFPTLLFPGCHLLPGLSTSLSPLPGTGPVAAGAAGVLPSQKRGNKTPGGQPRAPGVHLSGKP